METNLKDINFGFNEYCGPAVLSTITGKSTDECAAVIGNLTGRSTIRGVEVASIVRALNKLGFDANPQKVYGYSVHAALSQLVKRDGIYLVVVPRHIVAIEVKDGEIFLCDNHTKHPINAASSARLTQKCEHIFSVEKIKEKPAPMLLNTEVMVHYLRGAGGPDSAEVRIYDYYDNKTNKIVHLSSVKFRNLDELHEIITGLNNVYRMVEEDKESKKNG